MEKMAQLWRAFLHWGGWKVCARGWKAFAHWPGWSNFVHWKFWRAFASWPGWKKIFFLPPLVTVLLMLLSGGGLWLVFANGLEMSPVAYVVYVLSAYTLTVLAVDLPGLVVKILQLVHAHPAVEKILKDKELRFKISLYFEQCLNFGYGILKTANGLVVGSAWIGADGIYNLTQGIMQLFQILRRRKNLPMEKQWKSYRFCGWMTLVLHLTTTGLIFQMIHWGRSEDYPGFMIFATAAFAFYKLISSFVDVAKDRKHSAPVDSAVRMLDLSQAFFSIFSLQVAMFHVFGEGFAYEKLMNTLTGGAVCLLTVGMGVYMIRRANREIKNK